MNGIELLPCPFCGGEAKLLTEQISEDDKNAYVKCFGCEATTDIFEGTYAPTADAIAAWNKRPASEAASTIEALQARVKVLEEEIKELRTDLPFVMGWNEGFEHALNETLNMRFPTMLRMMWSGGEVQEWIDEKKAIARQALGASS